MATNPKLLFRGAATTNTATNLYTTPSLTTTVVTNIVVTNTASLDATYTLTLDGIALATTVTIGGNTSAFIDLRQVLVATDTISGGASAATVNFHISGVEIA